MGRTAENVKNSCSNAAKYTGTVYPGCNGGNPCESCMKKWLHRQVPDIVLKHVLDQMLGKDNQLFKTSNMAADIMNRLNTLGFAIVRLIKENTTNV